MQNTYSDLANTQSRNLDKALIHDNIIVNQTALIDELLYAELLDGFEADWVATVDRVHEWWLVTDLLATALATASAVVIQTRYGTWWGRQTTGTPIELDEVIQEAAASIRTENQ